MQIKFIYLSGFIFLFLINTKLLAQQVTLTGQVLDENKHTALEFASIEIWNKDSALLKTVATGANGKFKSTVTVNRGSNLVLKISFIGYETKEVFPVINYREKEFSVPAINLSVQKKYLQEVTVNGHKKNTSTLQIDKQVIDAKKFQTAANGTGLDLLKKIPSVTINNEGDLTLRGNAGLVVFINGAASNRTAVDVLSQLPSNTIENIEIITSPSAKYEANGKAGIINIITKKNINRGWGISSNGMFGGIDPLRFAGDVQINYNAKKWNYFASADYRRYDINGHRIGIVRSIVNDTLTYLPSDGVRDYRDHQYSFKTGIGFAPSDKDNFTITYYYGFKESDRTANLHYQQYVKYPSSSLFTEQSLIANKPFYNKNLFVRTGEFSTASIDYTHLFNKKSKLTLSGIYEYSVLGGPLDNSDAFEGNANPYIIEHSDERSPLHGTRLQADYALQVANNLKFETGYQLRILNEEGFFTYKKQDSSTSWNWVFPADFNDHLLLHQQTNAGYIQLNGSENNLSYSAGVRVENMHRTLTEELSTSPHLLNKFIVFPTVQLLWKQQLQQQFKLSYSKRVDWPAAKLLSPFKNHRHQETIEVGDPDLRPEIANIVEAAYSKQLDHIHFTTTLYYNYVQDKIFRINAIYNPAILLRTYTNGGNTSSVGIELASDINFVKWCSFFVSGNVYHYSINNTAAAVNTSSINSSAYINATVDVLPRLKFQLDLNYTSATVTSQGHDSQLLFSNAGLKYTAGAKKNVALGLQLNNIFDGNNQNITTQTSTFYSSTNYIKYDRVLQLSVSIRFNENNAKKIKAVKTEYGEKEF